MRRVPRERWDPGRDMASEVSQRVPLLPVVLTHTVADRWPARTRWTPEYLAQHARTLRGVYWKNGTGREPPLRRVFGPIWIPSKPLAALPSVHWRNPHERRNVSALSFFERVAVVSAAVESGAAPREFLYYTGYLDALGRTLAAEAAPLDALLLTPKTSQVNVWVGPAGVVAHLHYDSYHNCNVQLFGRKRFVVFAPSEWRRLRPFPSLHPSHAQAQVDVLAPDAARFPGMCEAEAWEAELGPGDMLYLPPLWFHTVEALSTSVSVNVWSYTRDSDAVDRALRELDALAPRVEAALNRWQAVEPRAALRSCALRLVRGVAERTLLRGNAVRTVRELVRSRYEDLVARGELEPRRALAPRQSAAEFCGPDPAQLPASLARLVDEAAAAAASALREGLHADGAETWMGSFVESVGLWSTSMEPEAVVAWLWFCVADGA